MDRRVGSLPAFRRRAKLWHLAKLCVASSAVFGIGVGIGPRLSGQVFTVEQDHTASQYTNLTVIQPTAVELRSTRLTARGRDQLIRHFQSEQAFAVRPLPLGRRGLTLHANGPLDPAGKGYTAMLETKGISAKPGDRLIISKFDIKPDRIVFEFNGGPEKPHHILQHISIVGAQDEIPLAEDNGELPVGSRLTLVFDKFVPEMTDAQLRALVAPIFDFSMKTQTQAFADTLPPKIRNAILEHQVLVGMNRDMVMKSLGRPDQKIRESDGQTPFEEWIYGQAPQEVQFVRFNGDRVIRLEIADVGQPLVIRDKDETGGYWQGVFVHEVRMGDAPPLKPGEERGPQPAPTLRSPGEDLPDANNPKYQLERVQLPPGVTNKDAGTAAGSSAGANPAGNPAPGAGGNAGAPSPSPPTLGPSLNDTNPPATPSAPAQTAPQASPPAQGTGQGAHFVPLN